MTDPDRPCPHVEPCLSCRDCCLEYHDHDGTRTGSDFLAVALRKTGIHVIPNAGTLLIDADPDSAPDGATITTAAVRMVKGTLLIDGDTATLHAGDGTAIAFAGDPEALAFIKAQAGIEEDR